MNSFKKWGRKYCYIFTTIWKNMNNRQKERLWIETSEGDEEGVKWDSEIEYVEACWICALVFLLCVSTYEFFTISLSADLLFVLLN